MKKYYFLLVLLFSVFTMKAQFSVYSEEVGSIADGDVLEFGTVAHDSEANFSFKVFNESDEPIKMRVKAVSIENTDGSNFEICFGMCYYSVVEGMTYPLDTSTEGYVTIQPGESQIADDDHFWNQDTQGINPDEDISYVFEFQQLDDSGYFVEETLTFTYTYSRTLDVKKHDSSFGVKIVNTLINNGKLSVQAQKPAGLEIYNLLGQKIKSSQLRTGMNTIEISDLSSQIYLVRIRNAQGELQTSKIVVQ